MYMYNRCLTSSNNQRIGVHVHTCIYRWDSFTAFAHLLFAVLPFPFMEPGVNLDLLFHRAMQWTC